MDAATAWRWLRWPVEWMFALRDLPNIRRDLQELKRAGGDPLRCTACGSRLSVTNIADITAEYGPEITGEKLSVRCATPGCAFTPRIRVVRFAAAGH